MMILSGGSLVFWKERTMLIHKSKYYFEGDSIGFGNMSLSLTTSQLTTN